MRIRRLAVLAAALPVGAAVLLAGPVASAAPSAYPPGTPAITVSADVVDPGQGVTVTGSGFQVASDVSVTWTGPGARGMVGVLPFGARTLTADALGVAATVLTFTTSGTHTITMAGVDPAGAPVNLSTSVDVRAAAGAGPALDLPHTGFPVLEVAGMGAAMLLLGTLVVLSVRRRRTAPAAAPGSPSPEQQPAGAPRS